MSTGGGQARIQMEDGSEVAYVRLHYFTSQTSKSVQAALLSGEQDGVSGYIFDLRNNPGALLKHHPFSGRARHFLRVFMLSKDSMNQCRGSILGREADHARAQGGCSKMPS